MPGRLPPPVRFVACVAFAALALQQPAAAADCPADGTGRHAMVCEINAAREEAGRGRLQPRPSLGEAARGHAADMVARGYFSHVSPEGDGPAQRARRAGYMRRADSWRIGEVLVWSRGSPLTAAAAVDAWLASPPHRRVLLSPRYRDIGAGVAAGAPAGDPSVAPATTVAVVLGVRR